MRYFFSLWTAFVVYSLFTFLFGPSNLQVQKHMEAEIERLSKNLNSLEITNKNYKNIASSLESDRETLSVYMRQLGYCRPDEKFIRIVGLESSIIPEMSHGEVLRASETESVSDKKIKITALIFALVMVVFFFTIDLLSLSSRRN